jgi:hypothetical protein
MSVLIMEFLLLFLLLLLSVVGLMRRPARPPARRYVATPPTTIYITRPSWGPTPYEALLPVSVTLVSGISHDKNSGLTECPR